MSLSQRAHRCEASEVSELAHTTVADFAPTLQQGGLTARAAMRILPAPYFGLAGLDPAIHVFRIDGKAWGTGSAR